MSTKIRQGLPVAVTGALLGLLGCGAPSAEEAQALHETRQSLVTGPDFIIREVSSPPQRLARRRAAGGDHRLQPGQRR